NEVKLLESETLARRVGEKLGMRPEDERLGPMRRLLTRLRHQLRFLSPSQTNPQEWRTRKIQTALTVRTSLQSQVIELFYDAFSPTMAASGAEAAASVFMDLNREARWQSVRDATGWLSEQAADLKAKLETANLQLEKFARSSELVFAGKSSTL